VDERRKESERERGLSRFTFHMSIKINLKKANKEKKKKKRPHLADRHLHDGVEAPLRRVQVPRDLLLADQAVELVPLVRQVQDVLVAEGAGAVLVPRARVDEPGRSGADVRHHRLLHERAETFKREESALVLVARNTIR